MTTTTFSHALKTILTDVPMRGNELRFSIFPSLAKYYILPKERELLFNIQSIRNELRKIVEAKRTKLQENPTEGKRGDLMTILLQDDLFKDDVEMIIDECVTFFLAGTQTTFNSITTTLAHTIKRPFIREKMLAEINNFVLD
eukprot:CAMPEP_0170542216 /NCGR_PEP_ID=MMETSP0211-20121228/1713_1 /TAXON_ID=311385 /ORGANISM="Pseudokeronopsis sp., Strain OXSARD2" /LENGTH=141 /DNA_ID=CAMNT_0010845211 /DNA_START=676 /DNA_END=1101 /DNA_ORIENTATION=+